MVKTSAIIILAGIGIGAVWFIQSKTRPVYDSLGVKIDYSHSISWIKPTTDPKIIAQARGSWLVEERARKEKLGDHYIERPFDISDFYGGYRPEAQPDISYWQK